MRVGDIMTTPLVTVSPGSPVEEAVEAMLQHSISGLPVIDSAGRLAGILTEGDFLRRAETGTERRRPRWLQVLLGPGRLAGDYVQSHARRVEEIMTPEPKSLTEDASLEEAVELMERHRIKRVPILRDGKPIGMVCRSDLLKAFAQDMRRRGARPSNDKEIEARLLAELDSQAWAPRQGLRVSVADGVVDFSGVILDERERAALRVIAENVPGVKKVTDHLTWVEPMSGTILSPEDASPTS